MSIETAHRLNVTEAEYHADPCETPSISSSFAKLMLSKSPLHAWHSHPRLGAGKREEKKTYDRGHLAHKLVLGKGRDIAIVEAKDWRTKAAQEARDQAYQEGKIPALVEVYQEAIEAAKVINQRLADLNIFLTGESEVAITWQEQSNRGQVHARAMLDHVIFEGNRATVYDFKSSTNAHPRACVRHIINYGYDIQQAAYTSGLSRWKPEVSGRIDFVFLFAEFDTAPYAVCPGRLDGMLREHGERGWTKAVIEFGDNAGTDGEWPGYTNRIVTFEAPGWLLADQESDDG